jgi:hypothetical protein
MFCTWNFLYGPSGVKRSKNRKSRLNRPKMTYSRKYAQKLEFFHNWRREICFFVSRIHYSFKKTNIYTSVTHFNINQSQRFEKIAVGLRKGYSDPPRRVTEWVNETLKIKFFRNSI